MDWEAGLRRGPFTETQINQLIELVPGLDSGQLQWLNGYLTGVSLSAKDIVLPPQERPDVPSSAIGRDPVWILYGSHTGHCEALAKKAAERLASAGLEAFVRDMGTFRLRELSKIKTLLVIVSTDGEGDPPPAAEELHAFLRGGRAPSLQQMRYGVLALGDSSYICFCQTGKDFDAALAQLGAGRITPRIDCDVDYEADFERWMEEVLSGMEHLSVRGDGVLVQEPVKGGTEAPAYSRSHPFAAAVLAKINLNGRQSSKETLHLELDLAGSGLRYEPGDALGVYARNPPELVEALLQELRLSGEETVETHRGTEMLRDALTDAYELRPLTAYSLSRYAEMTGCDKLQQIVADKASIAAYVHGRDILDLIRETPGTLAAADLIAMLRKNTARMYSIASSQRVVGDEVHIAVSVLRYEAHGRRRGGHCSAHLADAIAEGGKLPVFIDANSRFKLPADADRPIIMIGAGTGIAPYRAFMQERESLSQAGKSWLFFGDRNFTTDFLYQAEWLQYRRDGILTRADVAFSRDQAQKIYVQDRMMEQGKALYAWLEEGAHVYVCGDKSGMARGVEQAWTSIIAAHGGMTEDRAAEYIRRLQQENRYQTDVY